MFEPLSGMRGTEMIFHPALRVKENIHATLRLPNALALSLLNSRAKRWGKNQPDPEGRKIGLRDGSSARFSPSGSGRFPWAL
jgi:hypothetical protein